MRLFIAFIFILPIVLIFYYKKILKKELFVKPIFQYLLSFIISIFFYFIFFALMNILRVPFPKITPILLLIGILFYVYKKNTAKVIFFGLIMGFLAYSLFWLSVSCGFSHGSPTQSSICRVLDL